MRGSVIGNSSADHLVEDRPSRYRLPFLASQRALAACTREFARLGDEVVRGVAALPGSPAEERNSVRRSPDRFIVQLGPVALTIAWLRGNHDAVAAGELLVIVWCGAVAPRQRHQPERPATGPAPLGATPLWEQVLAAVGDSEETWAWQPHDDDVIGRCSSAELAARCVGRLRAAYLEREVPLPLDRDAVSIT
jgi:hypothetical protein